VRLFNALYIILLLKGGDMIKRITATFFTIAALATLPAPALAAKPVSSVPSPDGWSWCGGPCKE